MVATVSVYYDTVGTDGSPGTSTDVGPLGPPSIRFKTADNATIDSLNPVPIPTGLPNRSFVKALYLKCTVAPDTQIDNLKFYTDPPGSSFGTGITLYIGNQFPTRNSGSTSGYRVATGTVGTTGNEMTAVYASITTKTDAFTFIQTSPMTGPTISEAGGIINATNETSNYFVVQADVASTASPGNKVDQTLVLQFDEI